VDKNAKKDYTVCKQHSFSLIPYDSKSVRVQKVSPQVDDLHLEISIHTQEHWDSIVQSVVKSSAINS
jgi:hypothetical protein